MPSSRPWFLFIIGLCLFILAPTQAAIIYDYSPPAKKKKRAKKRVKKQKHRFSLFDKQKAKASMPPSEQQQTKITDTVINTVLFILFLAALIVSIVGLIVFTSPVLFITLIALNALSVLLLCFEFLQYYFFLLGVPILLIELLLIGITFGLPWLWIPIVALLAIVLTVILLFLIGISTR